MKHVPSAAATYLQLRDAAILEVGDPREGLRGPLERLAQQVVTGIALLVV
jgi:hypothetical protein